MKKFKPWEFRNKYGVSKAYAYKTGVLICNSFLCSYDLETTEMLGCSIKDFFLIKVKEKTPPRFSIQEDTYKQIKNGDTIRCSIKLSL